MCLSAETSQSQGFGNCVSGELYSKMIRESLEENIVREKDKRGK